VTPKVTADKVLTNSIEASTQSDITLKLADNGRVVMTDQAGKEVASFASDGNASIALDLGVEGSLTVGSTAKFNGSAIFSKLVTFVEKTVFKNDVTFEGHVLTSGETPAGEVKPAAGAEATVGVEGTDTSGQLTFKPGQGAAAGPVLSLEFKKPYAKTPRVLLTPANEFAANSKYFVEGTPTGFTITFSDPPTDSSAAQFNYWVVQ